MRRLITDFKFMTYAGFWKRFLALIIDTVIVTVARAILLTPFGGMGMGFGPMMDKSRFTPFVALSGLVGLVLTWLYFALMESSSKRATLGKMALGIEVADLAGNRISFERATGRYFAKILSGLILLIGYIMVAFTEKKQALHDILAGTLVVNAAPKVIPPQA